jgi:hypothetical protein
VTLAAEVFSHAVASGLYTLVSNGKKYFTAISHLLFIVKAMVYTPWTLMKTGPVRNAQQKKQCVYNIPYDCDNCYIGERSRHLEVFIKEHKVCLKNLN